MRLTTRLQTAWSLERTGLTICATWLDLQEMPHRKSPWSPRNFFFAPCNFFISARKERSVESRFVDEVVPDKWALRSSSSIPGMKIPRLMTRGITSLGLPVASLITLDMVSGLRFEGQSE